MIRIACIIALLMMSFAGGVFYERSFSETKNQLSGRIAELDTHIAGLESQNERLNSTLQLVKRQIQTDRVAYQSLQEIVEVSQQQRDRLKAKLDIQQALLKRLSEQVENPPSPVPDRAVP